MKGQRIRTGVHFMMGNVACAEGAIAAGCEFAAGYPITPASEIVNHLAVRLPKVGGIFFQSEDEISAVCSAIGASWSGKRAMTATSGPGISLMQENIGFAVATETPLVIVDVQRLGPSTGVPSIGVAGDMVQVARGSHGDYQIVALCPSTAQEMFDLTVRAFDLAERFRVPVFVMADAFLGHMRERVEIPAQGKVPTSYRAVPPVEKRDPMERVDFLDENVAPMPIFGRGYKAHVTSSCHDGHGMRNLSDPEVMHRFITNPIEKVLSHREEIVQVEDLCDGAEIALISYGTVSRCAKAAAQQARSSGMKVGSFRLITCWPLPDEEIRDLAQRVKGILVLENNNGQLYPYIRAEAAHACEVRLLKPRLFGQIHEPNYVVDSIKEVFS